MGKGKVKGMENVVVVESEIGIGKNISLDPPLKKWMASCRPWRSLTDVTQCWL